jgi:hypothetical protein
MIRAQRQRCGARTWLFLVGYSQGAELTGDAYLDLLSDASDASVIHGVVL